VPHSTQLDKERIASSTPESEAGVLVVRRHHLLVRCSQWLNVPILLGLLLSGMSIYWASPVYQHKLVKGFLLGDGGLSCPPVFWHEYRAIANNVDLFSITQGLGSVRTICFKSLSVSEGSGRIV
jgi:hypothetical protein